MQEISKSISKRNKYIIISILAIIIVSVFTIAFPQNVPLDSQPYDYGSAKKLAKTIARIAKCGNFEYYDKKNDHVIFSCQKDISRDDKMFTITAFYNKQAKEKRIVELINDPLTGLFNEKIKEKSIAKSETKNGWKPFLVGPYYVVVESFSVESLGPGHQRTEQDYAGFLGEMVR